MAGLHLRQAGAARQAQGREAHLQERGQRHQDGDLHREDLPAHVHIPAHGHPGQSQPLPQGLHLNQD